MAPVNQGMVVEDRRGPIGVVGNVDQQYGDQQTITVRLSDGRERVLLPNMYRVVGDRVLLVQDTSDDLTQQASMNEFDPNRTQVLPTNTANHLGEVQVDAGEDMVIPVVREEAVVGTRAVERGGVRVHKTVNEREEVVEQPTLNEHVEVERVAIGRVVESAPEVREEGDTLIIPVMEEMLVVEKRLILKEEIRITKHRTTETEQARVVLREEQVEIERINDQETIR